MNNDPIKAKIQELCPDVMESYKYFNPDSDYAFEVMPRITLALVLRAIHGAQIIHPAYAVSVVTDGTFMSRSGEYTGAKWNLYNDNYDQQSEECKQFIGNLLGVK